jgi:hypothetical protein
MKLGNWYESGTTKMWNWDAVSVADCIISCRNESVLSAMKWEGFGRHQWLLVLVDCLGI